MAGFESQSGQPYSGVVDAYVVGAGNYEWGQHDVVGHSNPTCCNQIHSCHKSQLVKLSQHFNFHENLKDIYLSLAKAIVEYQNENW